MFCVPPEPPRGMLYTAQNTARAYVSYTGMRIQRACARRVDQTAQYPGCELSYPSKVPLEREEAANVHYAELAKRKKAMEQSASMNERKFDETGVEEIDDDDSDTGHKALF